MTGWDVFTGRASLPPGTLAELAALPGSGHKVPLDLISADLSDRLISLIR